MATKSFQHCIVTGPSFPNQFQKPSLSETKLSQSDLFLDFLVLPLGFLFIRSPVSPSLFTEAFHYILISVINTRFSTLLFIFKVFQAVFLFIFPNKLLFNFVSIKQKKNNRNKMLVLILCFQSFYKLSQGEWAPW